MYYDYDADAGALERVRERQVNELADPEHLACSCGVRGMTREEARDHVAAAREQD